MKISVVTATYNSGDVLRNAIESVLAQDYDNFEHIIIDGKSTDNTLDIIREYEPLYKGRLHWISEPDRGIYDAMNKGMMQAQGDVIGLLNSDDFFTSADVLSTVAREMGDNEAVYGDVHYVNPSNLKKCVRYYSSRIFRRWHMRMGFMPAHPSFYARRDVFTRYGLFDLEFKVSADFEHLLRLIFINRIRTCYIHKDFVTMRTGGVTTSGLRSHVRIFKDHLRAYRKNGVYSNPLFEAVRYLCRLSGMLWFKLFFHPKSRPSFNQPWAEKG